MKEEIINQIQVQMLPYLNNEQLKALQSVLEHTFLQRNHNHRKCARHY